MSWIDDLFGGDKKGKAQLARLERKVDAIMAAIDDLKAAQAATQAALTGIQADINTQSSGIAALADGLNTVNAGIDTVGTEVQTLLDLIASQQAGAVPQEVVDQANAVAAQAQSLDDVGEGLKASVDAVNVAVQSMKDKLAAIPKN